MFGFAEIWVEPKGLTKNVFAFLEIKQERPGS
jgi:hypothetical protein